MLVRLRVRLVAALVVGLMMSGVGAVAAQDATSFYKGKTVKFVVGTGVGGGYDAYARMLAPHLAKALDATVIVENRTGAGGLLALVKLYSIPGDGLELMLVNGTAAVLSQLLEDQIAKQYDMTKVGLLGIVASSPWLWTAPPNSPSSTPADFIKAGKKVTWAASGVVDSLGDGAAIVCMTLKLDCRIVRGYDGTAAATLALTRGEVDSLYLSDTSARNYVNSNSAKPIATIARQKSRFFPNLATIHELVTLTPDQAWWFDFRATADDMGRILVTPPNLPKDQLAYLQETFRKILTDPAVIAEGEKSRRYIAYVGPDEAHKKIGSLLTSITPAQKKLAQEVIMKEWK